MVKLPYKKSNILSLGIIIILILNLIFMGFKERNINVYHDKIYISALQNNLVRINNSTIYLDQIINDYENINNYELKLKCISQEMGSMGEILPIIMYYDKSKSFFSINRDEYLNSFVEVFMKYSQIVNDWSTNIDKETGYGYPRLEDL